MISLREVYLMIMIFQESYFATCNSHQQRKPNKEGNGIFKFDYGIHKDTKKWCKEEIYESMKKGVGVIIVDNGNFEIWGYSKYVRWAKE